jgi:hypothetical protein
MKLRPVVMLATTLPLFLGATPARAQDFFGLFRLFSQPVVSVPTYQPYDYRTVPEFERPTTPRRPRIVEQPAIKMPSKPKAPGEVTNPVPELLADSTLRRDDMVMFPDGLRVFTGREGAQHALSDFEPLTRKTGQPETRKLLATFQPGQNAAWSAEGLKPTGKLATNRTIEQAGTVGRTGR